MCDARCWVSVGSRQISVRVGVMILSGFSRFVSVFLFCSLAALGFASQGDLAANLAAVGGDAIPASPADIQAFASTLPSIPTSEGTPLLPVGTVCDSAVVEGTKLTVKFTIPADAGPGAVNLFTGENVGEVLRLRFSEPLELNEILVLVRRAGDTEYGPFDALVSPPARAAMLQDDDWFEPDGPGPIPSPDYSSMQPADGVQNVAGQGPMGTSGQPQGALSGRTVFFSAGHGWIGSDAGSWNLQRPLLLGMNEDYGNYDQIQFFAHYLFNAGATVVAMRPIGYQKNEVVMDNIHASFSGTWSDSSSSVYFGPGGPPYRWASANTAETATATYTPNIPVAGVYPVYCWANYGSDRTLPGQLYRIRHLGGETSVRVNHRRVGRGWVWLGSYQFAAGANPAAGSVVISNQSSSGSGVVIADGIRFGNGIGDVVRGRVSGFEREAEGSRYWVQRAVGAGMSSGIYDLDGYSDGSDNVGTPPRMAAEMRRDDGQGYNGDIYLGWHSNASSAGTARGATALITNVSMPVNQAAYATLVSDEIEADCLVEDANWEYTWATRSSTGTNEYGEIKASALNNEMNGTIIEVAFHDNVQDAALLKDPRVRNVTARAAYQGILRYFNQYDSAPLAFLPDPPVRVRAANDGSGNVVVSWQPAPINGAGGGAATSYRLYTSADGKAFNAGIPVAGTSTVVSSLVPGTVSYFRVAAVNAGGESLPSEVVGARSATAPPKVLVVNGYDRLDRLNDIPEFPSNAEDDKNYRLLLERNNSYDYIATYGAAIAESGYDFDSCSNEAVISGDVTLQSYPIVVWCCGEESTSDKTLDATERSRLQAYLQNHGNLFISGTEIGMELNSAAPSFYADSLRALFGGDDANTYQASGVAGSIFAGLSFNFSPTPITYDADKPDVVNAANGSVTCATYAGGASAAVQYSGAYRLVNLGFPFENLAGADLRRQTMKAALDFLAPWSITTLEPAVIQGNEGAYVLFGGTFNDPDARDTISIDVDWGDGSNYAAVITSAAGGAGFAVNHVYADDNPSGTSEDTYMVTISISDQQFSQTINVRKNAVIRNVVPTFSLGGTTNILEGDTATITGSVTDPGVQDTFVARVNWGDGSESTVNVVNHAFTADHSYVFPGLYQPVVRVTDDDGGFTEQQALVDVANVAPTIGNQIVPPVFYEGIADAISGFINDPGTQDVFRVVVDWGDGSPLDALDRDSANRAFEISHVYASAGYPTIQVGVTDADGEGSTITVPIRVRLNAPDLRGTIQWTSPTLQVGLPAQFEILVENIGVAPATGVTVALSMSTTFTVCSTDPPSLPGSGGTRVVEIGGLGVGESRTVRVVVIPRQAGASEITAEISSDQTEDEIADNHVVCIGDVSPTVSGIDLSGAFGPVYVNYTPLPTGGRKSAIAAQFFVSNAGNKLARTAAVKIVLSRDTVVDRRDIVLLNQRGSVALGSSRQILFTATPPPVGDCSGWYLIALVDYSGWVRETDETNNRIVFGPIP